MPIITNQDVVTREVPLEEADQESCAALMMRGMWLTDVLESNCHVTLSFGRDGLILKGTEKDTETARNVLTHLFRMERKHDPLDTGTVKYVISLVEAGQSDRLEELLGQVIAVTHRGRPIRCKTLGQQQYVETIRTHDMTFAIGPAGTGKTYLAMALAVLALKNKEVERIVLTRPAVEAGERLGFLPGDMSQKVDPYLRPLYDALYDFMGVDSYQRMVERGTVEVAPLAFMRGRTLHDSFIILDEAQNTTTEQMKMFLTRMGFRSKMVITGDLTQTDLPAGRKSGLAEAVEVLQGIDAIGMVRLSKKDVVRHELVQQIVEAYENASR